ncbi:serine/threonine-protein kinase rio2 [Candidozyma auris]|nr:serine/threonine-protein kinase rio2 [[Candida] auris]
MRYLTADDFRVLQAVELGSRNHELVPTQIIHSVGGLKAPSATNRSLGDLAKLKLVARLRNAKYDGWRLMHTGFDYLALKTMLNRNTIYSVGTTIGVGKESDIYSVSDPDGVQKFEDTSLRSNVF